MPFVVCICLPPVYSPSLYGTTVSERFDDCCCYLVINCCKDDSRKIVFVLNMPAALGSSFEVLSVANWVVCDTWIQKLVAFLSLLIIFPNNEP